MKETEIAYKTSKDHKKLYELVKQGIVLVGFVTRYRFGSPVKGKVDVVTIQETEGPIYIGNMECLDEEEFHDICLYRNVQYIEPNIN